MLPICHTLLEFRCHCIAQSSTTLPNILPIEEGEPKKRKMNEYWIGAFLLGRKNKGEKNGSNKEKKKKKKKNLWAYLVWFISPFNHFGPIQFSYYYFFNPKNAIMSNSWIIIFVQVFIVSSYSLNVNLQMIWYPVYLV